MEKSWRGVHFPQALGASVEVSRLRTGSFAGSFTASCKLETSREHTHIVSVRVCSPSFCSSEPIKDSQSLLLDIKLLHQHNESTV